MRVRAIAAVSLILLSCGCTHQPAVQVVDLSAGRLPPGARIAIDGSGDEAVWRGAAVVPFEKTGEAITTQLGHSWDVKFSLAWSALGIKSPADQYVDVIVYRMVPKRPITHAARMGSLKAQR